MSLKPLHDWVLVELEATRKEATTSAGILLPHPDLVRKGRVLRVGRGRQFVDGVYRPTEAKEGDRVVFFAAVLDTKQGHQMLDLLENQALIRETDILFVIEEGDPSVER